MPGVQIPRTLSIPARLSVPPFHLCELLSRVMCMQALYWVLPPLAGVAKKSFSTHITRYMRNYGWTHTFYQFADYLIID